MSSTSRMNERSDGAGTKNEVEAKLDLTTLRYSMVWEDAVILSEALDIQQTDTVLSITSSGDNVLHLLLSQPRKIVAVDFSLVQSAMLSLKVAAIKELSREQALTLMGYTGEDKERLELLSGLKTLPSDVKSLLREKYSGAISNGLVTSGMLEKFFGKVGEACCVMDNQQRVKDFVSATTAEQRCSIFQQWPHDKIFNGLWGLFRNLAGHGRDSSQFKYVSQNTASYGRHLATRISKWFDREAHFCRPNHYLSAFLLGTQLASAVSPEDLDVHLPFYLHQSNYDRLKGLVDRIETVTGSIEQVLERDGMVFDKANLSDIFEYMSEEDAQGLMRRLAERSSVGGRIVFWNLFVERHPPMEAEERTTMGERRYELLGGLSASLAVQDRCPFYQDFFVCECRGD